MITQSKLKNKLKYDPITGNFFWIKGNGAAKRGSKAGHVSPTGYITISFGGKRFYAHRLAYLYMTGKFTRQVDHINRIRSDNRWCNLRKSDNSKNQFNITLQKNNTSGVTGVWFEKSRNKWVSRIYPNGKNISKRWDTFEEAVDYRKNYLEKKYGIS